jgi:hypothetical protein
MISAGPLSAALAALMGPAAIDGPRWALAEGRMGNVRYGP